MALVDRTLRCVVETPFKQLSQTPGIGPKKLNSLIMPLSRAANSSATNGNGHGGAPQTNGVQTDGTHDDPSAVSEGVWCRWRSNLRNRGLENEMLGRFVPSLRQLPRTVWRKRLDDYLSLSLAAIPNLRGHGEKRVAVLVEIIGGLNRITEPLASQPHVIVRVEPRVVAELEDWFAALSSVRAGTRRRAAKARRVARNRDQAVSRSGSRAGDGAQIDR